MKKKIARFVETMPVIGPLYRNIEQRMFFRHALRLRIDAGEALARKTGAIVQHGIFEGMKIHPQTSWGADKFTILTGQYEQELYGIIRDAADTGYPCFIDIGCANGFYAVGFAMIAPDCPVIAYDIDVNAREMTRLNAEINGVSDRITIKAEADHQELERVINDHGSAFLLIDIEGAETQLVDTQKCPALLKCDLLIELHGMTERVAEQISAMFSATHRIDLIARSSRSPFAFHQWLDCRFEDAAWVAVSEGRDFIKNNWLYLKRNGTA